MKKNPEFQNLPQICQFWDFSTYLPYLFIYVKCLSIHVKSILQVYGNQSQSNHFYLMKCNLDTKNICIRD